MRLKDEIYGIAERLRTPAIQRSKKQQRLWKEMASGKIPMMLIVIGGGREASRRHFAQANWVLKTSSIRAEHLGGAIC